MVSSEKEMGAPIVRLTSIALSGLLAACLEMAPGPATAAQVCDRRGRSDGHIVSLQAHTIASERPPACVCVCLLLSPACASCGATARC